MTRGFLFYPVKDKFARGAADANQPARHLANFIIVKMAAVKVQQSRFALLKVEDDDDSDQDSKKLKGAKVQQNGTAKKKKNKKKKGGAAAEDAQVTQAF